MSVSFGALSLMAVSTGEERGGQNGLQASCARKVMKVLFRYSNASRRAPLNSDIASTASFRFTAQTTVFVALSNL